MPKRVYKIFEFIMIYSPISVNLVCNNNFLKQASRCAINCANMSYKQNDICSQKVNRRIKNNAKVTLINMHNSYSFIMDVLTFWDVLIEMLRVYIISYLKKKQKYLSVYTKKVSNTYTDYTILYQKYKTQIW